VLLQINKKTNSSSGSQTHRSAAGDHFCIKQHSSNYQRICHFSQSYYYISHPKPFFSLERL